MESTKPNHLPALDGVRGIAVLMVMFFHYCQANDFFPEQPALKVLSKLSVVGQTGVDLFFVLSGFLITRILVHEKNKPGTFFKAFFARRVLRIFPLYYGFLVFIYFLIPILTCSEIVPFSKQIWFWSYLQNFVYTFPIVPFEGPNHLWSLAVEEHFYLVWPFLVYFLETTNLVRVTGGLILGGLMVRSLFLSHGIGVFFFTLCRLDGLILGAMLALLEHSRGLQAYQKPFLSGTLLLMGLLGGVWPYTTGRGLDWLQILKP
jgi:peptidoglycan/LPS O-acetylase OafA/YrhL